MGLFSRKKKVDIPSPPSDNLLKFPKPSQVEPAPHDIKKATGLAPPPKKIDSKKMEIPKPAPMPEDHEVEIQEKTVLKRVPFPLPKKTGPFFIRVQNHNQVLDDLDKIKDHLSELDKLNQNLEKSESGENNNYDDLKSELKRIHDRLTYIDSLIFKKKY